MFFRETRETEEDIRRMFCEARENMRMRITLKKMSYPGQFEISCTVKGIEFPHALCDTGASLSILPRWQTIWVCKWSLHRNYSLFWIVPKGIVRYLEVQIGNALVPVDFHVLDIKLNWNSSLLLGRAFLSTVGAVCNLQTVRGFLCRIFVSTTKRWTRLIFVLIFRDTVEIKTLRDVLLSRQTRITMI